jgi:hypothetical protein
VYIQYLSRNNTSPGKAQLPQEPKDPTLPDKQNVANLFLYLLGYEAGVGDRGERVGDGDEGEQVVGRDRVRQFPVTQGWKNIII